MHSHLYEMLAGLHRAIGRIETQLHINTGELRAIKVRVIKLERSPPKLSDFLPWLYGAVVLLLAALGKIQWSSVIGLLASGR